MGGLNIHMVQPDANDFMDRGGYGARFEHKLDPQTVVPCVDVIIHAKDEWSANFLGAHLMGLLQNREISSEVYAELKKVQDHYDKERQHGEDHAAGG